MVSCSPLSHLGFAQNYLDIAKLEEVTNQRTVSLQGIVVNVAPFIEGGAYQIQDKTGSVWIKTDRPLPRKGDIVAVKGEVAFEAIFIGPEKLGESYIIEITQPTVTTTDDSTAAEETTLGATNSPTPPENEANSAPDTPTSVETNPPETSEENGNPQNGAIAVEAVDSGTPPETVEVSTPKTPSEAPETEAEANDPPASGTAADLASTSDSTTTALTAEIPPKPERPNVDDQFLPHKRLAK